MFGALHNAFRDSSIKRKLTLIITLTSGLALALACGGFVLHDALTFRRVTLEATDTLAAIVGNNTAAALTFNDSAAASEVLAALAGEPNVIAAILYKNSEPFARYVRKGAAIGDPSEPPKAPFWRFDHGRLQLAHAVTANDTALGMLYVESELGALGTRLRRYLAIAAALLVAAMLAAYILAAGFQKVVSQPVSELVDLTRRVSTHQDYSMRAQRSTRDEIGELFDGFNAMLAQIQHRDVALKSAHEALEKRVVELQQQVAERVTAEKALQQQLTRINLLNQIANALSDRQDLDSIVRVVLAQLEQHLPIDFGSVSVFAEDRGELEVAAVRRRGKPDNIDIRALAPSGGLEEALVPFGECRAGQHVYFADTARCSHGMLARYAADDLRSVVVSPLMVDRRLFGLLVVARAAPNAFTSGECEFLRMLSEQVAVAGTQANLYTELQRAYTELRQSQRAMMQQERLRALGQMASGIAHDINNTLSPIVTFADILLEREQNLSEESRACLKNIQTAGSDIGGIVARLREFYRPRDANEPLEQVNLEALLLQVAELTRPRWRDMPLARGIVITLKNEFSTDVKRIVGHATELREAIINLILNAVDAMPDGGTLTLRTRSRADVGFRARSVVVEVCDTGVGMDDHTRQRCLEPFFSTKGQRGTGLGLAMVYGVMERHGGRIEVDSRPGAGTTMRLVFPSSTAPVGTTPDPFVIDQQKLPPLRILCVDDEPVLREVLLQLFKLDGHTISAADSGEMGLELFRQARQQGRPFDIIVTDLGMPHMDGRQLAQAVKHESPNTPIILLTGWGRMMQEDGDRPAGIDAVLSKPPRPSEMRKTLRQLMANVIRP